MSELADDMAEALGETIDFSGRTEFFIGSKKFTGDLSELGQQSFAIVVGGKETVVSATLVAELAQFGGTSPADNTRLRCKSQMWKVASKSSDTTSVTLNLTDADAH